MTESSLAIENSLKCKCEVTKLTTFVSTHD